MNSKQELAELEASSNDGSNDASNAGETYLPLVDIIEDENGITLLADLPGVTKENLAIRVDADMLIIEGTVTLNEAENIQPVYVETRAAQYKRTFTLSHELDASQIAASINDGVLTLHLPKLEQAKPRRIEVNVA
ncbi:Hsp20/alpha crystallin family protein [Glaciimonas immobilis]|uniref:HSP20 family molecular chaperone IbpA n=1 Tax=Glaciimonas immobilis TaxID=728004 RepID=A0A840RQC1_9BURK|nr:Hsp20/alpha crystallin family protein [Glaciimonas immobilis]KAF3997688.1 Hsp20/alpha crystallin family protein [Glaciimonas immobilis]MBB5200597.1 HSP20 family molecular chaperone IbpA [Glaciimonas immobilis]